METYTQPGPDRLDRATNSQLLHDAAAQMFAMRRVLRPLIQQAKALAAPDLPAHTSEAQLHVLSVLAEADYLPAGELAERCYVADPTMSRTLTLLETQGLIVRTTAPGDRRTVQVRLTEAGRQTQAASRDALIAGLARVLSPLTPAQLQDVVAALHHLAGLVDSEDHETKRHNHSYKEFR